MAPSESDRVDKYSMIFQKIEKKKKNRKQYN